MEYAGAGVNIQPAFTDTVGGATDFYSVIQVVLSPAAGASGQGYDDSELFNFFWQEVVPTFHVDSYQNVNLDPQIDDPWAHWDSEAYDEWPEWQYDSAANPGFVDVPPADGWPHDHADDIWEPLQASSYQQSELEPANPDGWYDPDDTADEWDLWQADSQANSGQVFQQPAEWLQDWDDDTADEWESWQFDSAANPGFVDIPPPDGWHWFEEETDEELWQLDEYLTNSGFVDIPAPDAWPWDHADDTADEWESWYLESAANPGFVDVPPADGWSWFEEDVDDEWVVDEASEDEYQPSTELAPEDAWPWFEEAIDDELTVDEVQAPVVFGQPPEDPWQEDDTADEWELLPESGPVVPDVVPPPVAIQPTDVRVQRPSRRNIRFKWGAAEAIEAEKAPARPPQAERRRPQVPALLKGLLKRVETGILSAPQTPITAPSTEQPLAPRTEAVHEIRVKEVPRESSAQRRERRLALVEPRRRRARRLALVQPRREMERGLELAEGLERAHREAVRRERLKVVEAGHLRKASEIAGRIKAITDRFIALQRKLDTAARQRERLQSLHQRMTRAAEEGQVHLLSQRVAEARIVEKQLRGLHTDLLLLDAELGGHLQHHEEVDRIEKELRRSRNNLFAVQVSVALLLGKTPPSRDFYDSE